MNTLPPDWDKDKKLWEILGKIRSIRPSSNFAYKVHQKLLEKSGLQRKKSTSRFQIFSIFRGWAGGFITATACVVLFMVWMESSYFSPPPEKTPNPSIRPSAPKTSISTPVVATIESSAELAQLVQNYELLQDLEAIEHLDEFYQ